MSFSYNFARFKDKIPVIEFLETLPVKERAKVFAYMDKLIDLKNMGLQPKENLSRHFEGGIFELRVPLNRRVSRVLYFYEVDGNLIYTHGFIKKSQKTPRKEIDRANEIRRDVQGG